MNLKWRRKLSGQGFVDYNGGVLEYLFCGVFVVVLLDFNVVRGAKIGQVFL